MLKVYNIMCAIEQGKVVVLVHTVDREILLYRLHNHLDFHRLALVRKCSDSIYLQMTLFN